MLMAISSSKLEKATFSKEQIVAMFDMKVNKNISNTINALTNGCLHMLL